MVSLPSIPSTSIKVCAIMFNFRLGFKNTYSLEVVLVLGHVDDFRILQSLIF